MDGLGGIACATFGLLCETRLPPSVNENNIAGVF